MAAAVLRLTVDVAAPAELTWAAATDWDRQGEWILGTRVSSKGQGLGAEIVAWTGIAALRLGFLDTMSITGWDPPRECQVVHTGRVVRGSGSFTVIARGPQASTFVWYEALDLPWGPLGRVGWAVLRPLLRAGVGSSLRRFARWAEHGV